MKRCWRRRDDTSITGAHAEQAGLPFVDLNEKSSAQRVDLNLVPDDLRKRFKIVPLGEDGGRLHLAIGDPMALDALDMLRFRLNRELVVEVASPSAIDAALDGSEGGGGTSMAVSSRTPLMPPWIRRLTGRWTNPSMWMREKTLAWSRW